MDGSKNQHLGVNKISKNIRKSPLHHPNFGNSKPPPPPSQPPSQPQPQVYNISKNDFRSIVQQLTGTPSRDPQNPNPGPSLPPPPRPPHPKPPSMRLQRIRPPPLTPIARPAPPHVHHPNPNPNPNPNHIPHHIPNHSSFLPRPVPSQPAPPPGPAWAESPVSAYMRYLESSLLSSDPSRNPRAGGGLLPSPSFPHHAPPFPSPRGNPNFAHAPPFPSPRGNGPPPFPSPRGNAPPFPSPRGNPPPSGLLPSPGPQFPLPSPSGFLNLLSPRSPYPLLSPGFQYPPPFTPNFFSPYSSQSGILGPGPQPPPSPGLMFPQSPSGYLPLLSPRWRDM